MEESPLVFPQFPGCVNHACISRSRLSLLPRSSRIVSLLTITVEYAHELRLGPPGELLFAECIPDHLVIAEDNDQLRAQAGGHERTVFLRKVPEIQVEVALEEGQAS